MLLSTTKKQTAYGLNNVGALQMDPAKCISYLWLPKKYLQTQRGQEVLSYLPSICKEGREYLMSGTMASCRNCN